MIQALIASDAPKPFDWNVEQYQQIGDLGIFEGKKVELIEGRIFQMSPMNAPHIIGLVYLSNELPLIANGRYTVLVQAPLTISSSSEPVPDCAVFRGSPSEYRKTLSKEPLLVIELSDSTLTFDRTVKASLYATAKIPEYWIVNLVEQQIEVMRDPQADVGYTTKSIIKKNETVRTIKAPDLMVEVNKFLP
jgi:Uma2 family endonuclease